MKHHYLNRFHTIIILLVCFFSCITDGEITRPETSDIFDKFIAKTILSPDMLPQETTALAFIPGSSEFLVLGKSGQVFHCVFKDTTAQFIGSFTIPDVAPAPGEIGLAGITFDPNFAGNRFFYLCFTTGDNKWNRIIRLRWSQNYDDVVQSIRLVIQVDRVFPDEPQHGIYDVRFGNDGMLYAAIGDATQPEFSQDPQSLLGKLIRIKPKLDNAGGYSIPQDNPFLDDNNTLLEIAALGLRTPFRLEAWQDKIYIAEVGQNRYEEIDLYTLGKKNFGWPVCEGYCETGGFQNPVFAISHADPIYQTQDPEESKSNRLSISLGVAYPDNTTDPYENLLDGRLIFNDVFQGYVRAALIEPDGRLRDDQHIFHFDFITSMAIGPDGYIYGTTIFPSQVFRVEMKIPCARAK
jgi:glucose/arabinose dehydrogenase